MKLFGSPAMLVRAFSTEKRRSYTKSGPGRMPHRKSSKSAGTKLARKWYGHRYAED